MMKKPVICHFLIGLPASGKSTFAQFLAEEINAVVVSTDEIRAQLYGDAANQGIWADIEVEVLDQIKTAVEKDQPVIYDATNAMRPWRLDFLYKTVNSFNIQWIGWHLQTSVEKCKQRNQQRERQVPDEVIDKMNANLQANPPESNEGLLKIYPVPVRDNSFDLNEIRKSIKGFKRLLANIANLNKNKVFHPYSRLLDFERLMHLMSVIINYPEIGNLAETEPENLKEILEVEELPQFSTSIEEICSVITKKY
ncbi:MAG: AAA family ATPase, partial [Microcystis sp.]